MISMSMKPSLSRASTSATSSSTSVTSRIPTRSIERRELCSTRGVRSMPSRVNRGSTGVSDDRRDRQPRRMHSAIRASRRADRSARVHAARRSSLLPEAHGVTDEDLRALPGSIVGGFVAETAANAFEAIEKLRRVYARPPGSISRTSSFRRNGSGCGPRQNQAGFCPSWTGNVRRHCSSGSRRSRSSNSSSTACFPAGRAFRSRDSTCSCRCSTRSSAEPAIGEFGTRCWGWRTGVG